MGLLTSEGETWLAHRRLAQPVFHRQRVAQFGTMITDACGTLLDDWQRYAATGEPFDVGR